jgi:hypothetical protein
MPFESLRYLRTVTQQNRGVKTIMRRLMKQLFGAVVGLSVCSSVTLHAQTLEWTQTLDSGGGLGVSADGLGSVYFSGSTHGDASVAKYEKYDSAGNQVWVRQLGSLHQDQGQAVSADRLGNIFIVGETCCGDGNDLGIGGIVPSGGSDAFVAKYNSSGNLDWVRQVAETSIAVGVSADGLGNAYFAGTASSDAFLGKYDAAGNLTWLRRFGSSNFDSARAVSWEASGYAYVAGSTQGNLGGPNAGGYDAYLAKYDAAGNQLWVSQFGTTGTDGGTGVSTDSLGNVYIAGVTDGSLGGPNAGDFDAYVRKYDASGRVLWTRQLGTPAAEGPDYFDVSADALGNVFLAGWTKGNLGGPNSGGQESPPYREDAFLAKYDGDGNLDWIWQHGTGAYEVAAGVSADGFGNAYVAGTTQCFSTSCTLDGTNSFWADAFAAKIRDNSVVPEPTSVALWVIALACFACQRTRRAQWLD